MILFVDLEHASGHVSSVGETILAARTRITYRLQEIADDICLLQHYTAVNQTLVNELGVRAVFLSGSSTDPDQYGEGIDGVNGIIRNASVPIFGFCGGFQFMMKAHGIDIVRIGPLEEGAEKAFPEYMPGWKTETGYLPVTVDRTHELLAGLDDSPVFRHFHGWEIRELPDGFVNLASTVITPIQMTVSDAKRQVGTQFHPEYFTDDHPEGSRLIENFCRWTGVLN